MNILFTDYGFNNLGGAERAARELILCLEDRGHRGRVFSASIGGRRTVAPTAGVKVVWDLDDLDFVPDVIHAQSHLDAMLAISSLPDVPAVFHCHGGGFSDTPPIHPRIYRYLAITETLARRLAIESNLPPFRIEVILNWVDLTLFPVARTPSPKPRKALVFGNNIRPNAIVDAVSQAVAGQGLELDRIGRRITREIDNPEEVLPNYDIVFASGKSAMDSLASGCAVIVLGQQGCGEMVRSDNFDRFRKANFTIPVNSPPPSVERIVGEIERYDAAEAAAVTQRLRRECGVDRAASRMEEIYGEVIAEHREARQEPAEALRATGRYLRSLVPVANLADDQSETGDAGFWSSDSAAEALAAQVAAIRRGE